MTPDLDRDGDVVVEFDMDLEEMEEGRRSTEMVQIRRPSGEGSSRSRKWSNQ